MRIKKVQIIGGKIRIEHQTPATGGGWDLHTLLCASPALDSFYDAIEKLAPFVAEILELSPDWAATGVEVRSITFSYGGEADVMGATISGTKELRSSNTPFNFHTPHKPSEPYSGGGDDSVCLSEKCVAALSVLQTEVERYLAGERAQMTFGFDEDEETVEHHMDDFDREEAEAAAEAPVEPEVSTKKPRRKKAASFPSVAVAH